MRRFLDSFVQVLRAMWAHKLRSFLTMFGIAWGVGSLLLLVGLGEGFRAGNREEPGELLAKISCKSTTAMCPLSETASFPLASITWTTRTISDIRNSPFVRNATPVIYRGDLRLVSEYGSSNGYVDGSEPQFYDIRYQPIDQGRWLSWTDEQQRNNVCVIGSEFVRLLFPGRPVVGSRLLINGVPFEVIGTIKKVGHGSNNDQNMRLIMPYTTMANYFPMPGEGNAKAMKYVAYQPITRGQHHQARDRRPRASWREIITSIPRRRMPLKNGTPSRVAEMVGKISDAMDAFLGAVGLVTLALGHGSREHHVGLCYGAHAGDRSAQGPGRYPREHPVPVLPRRADAYGNQRRHRSGGRLCGDSAFRTRAADRWIRTASHLPGEPRRSPWGVSPRPALSLACIPHERAALLTPVEALRQE